MQIKQLIFIPGNVPSSKNSKQRTRNGAIVHGKAVKRYLQALGINKYSCRQGSAYMENYKTRPNLFKQKFNDSGWETPQEFCYLGFHFVRKTKALFDFSNMVQIIQDLMVAGGFLMEDNIDCIIPINMTKNGKRWTKDKDNPGVWIAEITPDKEPDIYDFFRKDC